MSQVDRGDSAAAKTMVFDFGTGRCKSEDACVIFAMVKIGYMSYGHPSQKGNPVTNRV